MRRLIAGALGVAAIAAGCGTTSVRTDDTVAVNTTPTTATPTTPTTPTFSTAPTTPTVDTTSTTPTFSTTPTTPTIDTTSTPTVATVTPTVDTTPTRPRHLRPGAHVVPPRTYTRDVLQSLVALRSFSSTLRGIDSAGEFSARLASLRRDLRTFDGMIRRLRSYQLMSPVLDKQRKRLADQGPGLARTMSDFLDSVRDGNATRARSLANEVQTRLDRFRKSA